MAFRKLFYLLISLVFITSASILSCKHITKTDTNINMQPSTSGEPTKHNEVMTSVPERQLSRATLWQMIQCETFWTALLCVVTAVYVILTREILKANQRSVYIMQEQVEASLRPYIVPSTFLVPGNYMISLQISNVGKIAAEELRLNLDKDYYPPREKEEDERSLRAAYIFQNKIATFAPGERRVFYLGTGIDIFGDESSRRPHQFTITAIYSFSGKTVSEQTVIDLETYRESQLQPQDAVVKQLANIEMALKRQSG